MIKRKLIKSAANVISKIKTPAPRRIARLEFDRRRTPNPNVLTRFSAANGGFLLTTTGIDPGQLMMKNGDQPEVLLYTKL
nr:hypothetical protein Iba_chr13fCG9500 [Ipomoea batatas]